MVGDFEAKRAIHDEAFEIGSRESKPDNKEKDAQRAADRARRQAEAELRVKAWEKRTADHREADRQVAAIRSSDIWNSNSENRTRTFVSDELFPVQEAPGREEDLDGLMESPPAVEILPAQEPTVETSIIEVSDQVSELPPELPVVEEAMPEALPVEPEPIQEQVVELPVAEVSEPEPIIEAPVVETAEPEPELPPIVELSPAEIVREQPLEEVIDVLEPEINFLNHAEAATPIPEVTPEGFEISEVLKAHFEELKSGSEELFAAIDQVENIQGRQSVAEVAESLRESFHPLLAQVKSLESLSKEELANVLPGLDRTFKEEVDRATDWVNRVTETYHSYDELNQLAASLKRVELGIENLKATV